MASTEMLELMRFLVNLFYQGILWAPQACCGSGWSDSKMGTAANQGWPGTNNYKHHRGEAYVLRMIFYCNITTDWSSKVNVLAPYLVSSFMCCLWGSRDGAVVRALASHQCGPGLIPVLGVICGLSLLLVLVFAPRGFSPVTPVFPSPQKPTLLKSNLIWKMSLNALTLIVFYILFA